MASRGRVPATRRSPATAVDLERPRWIALGIIGLVVLLDVCVSTVTSAITPKTSNITSTAVPSPPAASTPLPTTPTPTRAPPTPPPAPKALFDVSGRNSGETPSFDGPPHYKVTYSFDCSNYFGGSGNFILLPVDA